MYNSNKDKNCTTILFVFFMQVIAINSFYFHELA